MKKIINLKNISILVGTGAILSLVFLVNAEDFETSAKSATELSNAFTNVSAAKLREIETSISAMETLAATERVKGSLGRVNLTEPNSQTRMALATIRGGLRSNDDEVVELASTYAESVFVLIAHGEKVDPAYRNDIHALFLTYDKYGQNQIRQMRKAFPASPTLAYLQKLKGN